MFHNINRFGFTLIELLVAISIIAILSTIGLTVFTGLQDKARDSRRISDIKESQKALEQYYAMNSMYPATNNLAGYSGINVYFVSGYIPTDPQGEYYDYKGCAEKYLICAKLENGGGNRTSPGSSCSDAVTDGGTEYYCTGSISN